MTLVMRALQSDQLSSLDAKRIKGVDPVVVEQNI